MLQGNFIMKNLKLKNIALGLALVGSSSAFAVDHSAAIAAAQTDADLSVTAAVTAVIGVAAIIFGVGYVIKLLTSR
jgi:hypothetical protein